MATPSAAAAAPRGFSPLAIRALPAAPPISRPSRLAPSQASQRTCSSAGRPKRPTKFRCISFRSFRDFSPSVRRRASVACRPPIFRLPRRRRKRHAQRRRQRRRHRRTCNRHRMQCCQHCRQDLIRRRSSSHSPRPGCSMVRRRPLSWSTRRPPQPSWRRRRRHSLLQHSRRRVAVEAADAGVGRAVELESDIVHSVINMCEAYGVKMSVSKHGSSVGTPARWMVQAMAAMVGSCK